mgnify:CR=1 FL=1
MKYQSQSVAKYYFFAALALFAIQVLGGLLAGWIYVSPNTLSELLPFNIVRMIHTNALIVWLLLGFFGAAYYLVPEEAERELFSTKLAYIQLIILLVGTLGRGALGEMIEKQGYFDVFILTTLIGMLAVVLCVFEWIRVVRSGRSQNAPPPGSEAVAAQ